MKRVFLFLSVGIMFGNSFSHSEEANEFVSPSLRIPERDDAILSHLDNTSPPSLTPEETADAPQGEFRKLHLREVNWQLAAVAATLAAAPPGPQGQQSPLFVKFQAWKTGLDKVLSSRLQRDVIDLLPLMQELSDAQIDPTRPVYFQIPIETMRQMGYTIFHIIAEHISQKNAYLDSNEFARILDFISKDSFFSPNAWEGEMPPIDSGGIMIIDPAATVARLKTKPWKEADGFLGGASAAEGFIRYTATGDGIEILKTKYAANQATITAKWNELAAWVAQQKAANP
jgi:hypothetical protein